MAKSRKVYERKRFLKNERVIPALGILIFAYLILATGNYPDLGVQAKEPTISPEPSSGRVLNGKMPSSRGERPLYFKAPPIPETTPKSSPPSLVESQRLEVKGVMERHPEEFTQQDFEDLEIYLPIYFEAAQKYDLPWHLLWVIHREESQVSRDPEAFTGRNGYEGGMQRDPKIYPKDYVDEAVSGAPEYLFKIKIRHPSDIREIYFTAKKLRLNINNSGQEGEGAIWGALHGYSARGPAEFRYQQLLNYQKIFSF